MGTSASPAGRDEASAADQRLSARRVVSEPIAVELQPGHEAWLRDLGEGGLSVSSGSPLELGTRATIRFDLPEADFVIDASGVVAWSDQTGRAGVRFTQVKPDSTAALRRWLSSGASVNASQSDAPLYDNDLADKVACLREVADLQAIISSEHLESSAALDLIVRRMAELTRATGAAIALREGQDVFCRASFGNAPDVGVKLSSGGSLSGECLRSGTTVLLEDSENDARVNPEVCRQLNFRSLLVLPVTSGTDIVGIAEVLSPDLRNFGAGDVLVMSFLTDLIASLTTPGAHLPMPEYSDRGMLPVKPLASIDARSSNYGIAPAVSPSAAPRIVRAPVSPFLKKPTAPGDEGLHRITKAVAIRIPGRNLAISIGTLLALALLLLGYQYRPNRVAAKPNNIPLSTPPSPSSIAAGFQPLPTSTTATPSKPGLETKASRPARPVPAAVTHERKPTATELPVIQGHTVTLTPAPESAAPEPLAMSALGPAHSSTSLAASIIDSKTAIPELSISQSQGVTPGKLIKRVVPQYPDMARRAGVSGDVVIAGIIRADGVLRNLKVVSGSPLLREAALDAARQWRYSPYLLGGKPVEAETRITISFHQ